MIISSIGGECHAYTRRHTIHELHIVNPRVFARAPKSMAGNPEPVFTLNSTDVLRLLNEAKEGAESRLSEIQVISEFSDDITQKKLETSMIAGVSAQLQEYSEQLTEFENDVKDAIYSRDRLNDQWRGSPGGDDEATISLLFHETEVALKDNEAALNTALSALEQAESKLRPVPPRAEPAPAPTAGAPATSPAPATPPAPTTPPTPPAPTTPPSPPTIGERKERTDEEALQESLDKRLDMATKSSGDIEQIVTRFRNADSASKSRTVEDIALQIQSWKESQRYYESEIQTFRRSVEALGAGPSPQNESIRQLDAKLQSLQELITRIGNNIRDAEAEVPAVRQAQQEADADMPPAGTDRALAILLRLSMAMSPVVAAEQETAKVEQSLVDAVCSCPSSVKHSGVQLHRSSHKIRMRTSNARITYAGVSVGVGGISDSESDSESDSDSDSDSGSDTASISLSLSGSSSGSGSDSYSDSDPGSDGEQNVAVIRINAGGGSGRSRRRRRHDHDAIRLSKSGNLDGIKFENDDDVRVVA